jgi:hypothetical protein
MHKLKVPISVLLALGLTACNAPYEASSTTEKTIAHDTIEVVTVQIDTVFIEKPSDRTPSTNIIASMLPDWFMETGILKDLSLSDHLEFDCRLNPMYLEADFNGDGILDVVFPIIDSMSGKKGFAVVHGKTHDIHIIGAGTWIKDALGDNMFGYDIWKINRLKINEPGLDSTGEINKNGPLHLDSPSIQIEASDVGGGQIYWNGKQYAYFHQTC